MPGKRKAGGNNSRERHRGARTETNAGGEIAGTSAWISGPKAVAAGGDIYETSKALEGLTLATTCFAGASPLSGGAPVRGFAPPHRQALAGQTATTQDFAVEYSGGSSQFGGAARARGAGGGSGYRGSFQPAMLSQGILPTPLGNPAGGRAPFTHQYHAPTGYGFVPGQNQIDRGNSGGLSSVGPRASSLAPVCTMCKIYTTGVWGLVPLCVDCYNYLITSKMLPKYPQIRYAPPSSVPGNAGAPPDQGIAIGHQSLRQPSSAAPARLTRAPTPRAQWCSLCQEDTTRALGSSPLCEVCYDYLFVPSSCSSSAVGSGPICQGCVYLSGTGDRACRFSHHDFPTMPGLG